MFGMADLPIRKTLNHAPPFRNGAISFFVTVCAAERGGCTFVDNSDVVIEAARRRHVDGTWSLSLFLVMPDHFHMLVTESPSVPLARAIADFKRYLATFHGLSFQRGFFDTRIRDDEHYAEKWRYIVNNPVAKGIARTPREWPHVIAFNRDTREEIPHR